MEIGIVIDDENLKRRLDGEIDTFSKDEMQSIVSEAFKTYLSDPENLEKLLFEQG